jgi:hypothetical protein
MKIQSKIIEIMLCLLSWLVGYFVTQVIADGLSTAQTLSIVIGWWFTAYIASNFSISLAAAYLLSGIYFLIFFALAFAEKSWLYRDAGSLSFQAICEVGLLQAFFVASPILFNRVFQVSSVFIKSKFL